MNQDPTRPHPWRRQGFPRPTGWRCPDLARAWNRHWPWLIGLVSGGLLLVSCATAPPRNANDACAIFAEYDDWLTDARTASRRWGVPLPVLLAIMRQESAFQSDAQPPRRWYLGFIPGPRPSSAYGYSQALDGTWERYIAATGNRGADRDDFGDAVDFIGWYVNETAQRNRIAKSDAYNQYLAYHEGHSGYARGNHHDDSFVRNYAQKVQDKADEFGRQLATCT
jgi:hypothetical protein